MVVIRDYKVSLTCVAEQAFENYICKGISYYCSQRPDNTIQADFVSDSQYPTNVKVGLNELGYFYSVPNWRVLTYMRVIFQDSRHF